MKKQAKKLGLKPLPRPINPQTKVNTINPQTKTIKLPDNLIKVNK